jgi:hypothetical protein
VADDWRLTASFDPEGRANLLARLRERRVESEAHDRLGGAVAVSAGGPGEIFVYGASREAVDEAQRILASLLGEHGLEATFAVHRWHELEERWEDPSVPEPTTEAEREAERARLDADEEAESRRERRALWEVRLILPSHGETVELADRFEQEGIPVIRRWNYLLVGAESEENAAELADRLRAEAPDAEIEVVGSEALAAELEPPNPFAIFGGLAG